MNTSNLSEIVIRLLEDGMTQTEIGAFVGCSQASVSDISKGKIGTTRPAYKIVSGLMKLAKKRGLKVTTN